MDGTSRETIIDQLRRVSAELTALYTEETHPSRGTPLMNAIETVAAGLRELAEDLEMDGNLKSPLDQSTLKSLESLRDLLALTRTKVSALHDHLDRAIETLDSVIAGRA